MKLWQQFEHELEQARRSIPGGPEGWRPERLIFRDWWHWKDQEFGFAHGRLALTGQNAGGKSSLLALTLPMLLDGRTDPIRLDPAQSRDRFLHYYLLGADDAESSNPEVFRYEARTGYVALEFFHVAKGRYLTVGMGVTASRTSARRIADWWGFLLLKGQRVGRGFDLRGADDACLGRREFTRLLGDGGLVLTERGEYQRQVNHHLFGLEDDDYQSLIEMLLQARRPKLGEQTGPDKVCDMLRRALPGVPSDRLTRVGEVVNNLEEYRRNLADVKAKAEAVGRIDSALLAVAEALVQEAALRYSEYNGRLGSVVQRLRGYKESLESARQGLAALEAEAAARAVERAACQAEEGELLQGDGADLQQRLHQAQDEVQAAQAKATELSNRLDDGRRHIAELAREQERLRAGFAGRTRQLASQMNRLAKAAGDLGWQDAAAELTEAALAVETLTVSDPAELIAGAAPPAGLTDEARRMQGEFRQAAQARHDLDEAEDRYQRTLAELDGLREAVKAAADQAENAKDIADDRVDDLIAALQHWQESSTCLQPSDVDVARVVSGLRELTEAPPAGWRALTEPLEVLAERRRTEVQQALAEHDHRLRAARLRQDRLAERLAAVQADPGDPARSQVRAAARQAGQDAAALPLFRQARFRPHVSAATAALVEAAVLEAGWLDLLVAPAGAERSADAYLVPEPLPGPSLLDLLEPEPGAPAEVSQALASVGWGEGAGERWVAPDGRWRNGPAHGQVASWAPAETGFFGGEARERRRARRIAEAEAEWAQAQAQLTGLEEQRQSLAEQIQRLERELRQLDEMPWQPWFDALASVKVWEQQRERVREKLEAAKPKLAEAERALTASGRAFDEAAAGLPGAAALRYEQLRQRAEDCGSLALELGYLLPPWSELHETAQVFRSQSQAMRQSETVLAELERDYSQVQGALAAAQARERLLAAQVQDPDFQTRLSRLAAVRQQLRELEGQEREALERQANLRAQLQTAADQLQQLEPEERELRGELAARLERVKARLRLHVQLQPLLEELEKAGPVAVLPKLPRPAASPQELEDLVKQRSNELIQTVGRELDLLRDFRPTWVVTGESLALYEERLPLAAHQLRQRLEYRGQEYQGLIEEEQRKLFQDIIYEGILDELRRLIRQAREFTRRLNDKLKFPLSNGEVLSLRFSPLPPEQVPAARIAAALEQMEQGHRFLPEDKREVLLSTIKEEVERVRAAALAAGQEISYHEAVIRALDYRNWYEYQLLSRMPGATGAVPIRSRGFGQRSNSAKAWALTVPVLAAVAARYDASPRTDLPRLIGLDEAFAGLDANNQENYLALLSKLGFSWIITIPDEVPYSQSLSAAMTYRMSLEGSFHAAFPILWNGQQAYEPMTAWADEVAAGSEP